MEEKDTRPELLKYGYAPGGYMLRCRNCDTVKLELDKRARCCLECAEAKFKEDNPEV